MRRRTGAPISFGGPLSLAKGIGQRIRNPWVRVGYWVLGAPLLVLALWVVVLMWYVVIFGLFGILVIPFRLLRRGQRRDKQMGELLEEVRKGRLPPE